MKKISHSAWKKYMTCPSMYDLHYNHRLRPKGTTSPLKFGVAIDEALNALLLDGKDPLPVFHDNFKWEDLQDVVWMDADLDTELFTPDQWAKVAKEGINYRKWASMRIKGRMLLEAYQEKILPMIGTVHSVQKDLEDRPGVLDAKVTLLGDNRPIILDHKTSARPYSPHAIMYDTQLALYAASEACTQVGFVVLVKQINKNRIKKCKKCGFNGSFTRHKTCPQETDGVRCHGRWNETTRPEATIQLMVNDLPQRNMDLITNSILQTEKAINDGIYPKNLTACGKIYGKPCPYLEYCWKGNGEGLEIQPERKKK